MKAKNTLSLSHKHTHSEGDAEKSRGGRRRGATGSHTAHSGNKSDEDNVSDGVQNKGHEKHLLRHLENTATSLWDIRPGSNAVCSPL